MNNFSFGQEYASKPEAETTATRKCLARVPVDKFDWKPHDKSMNLGYLSLLVAEIPKWIIDAIINIAVPSICGPSADDRSF